MRGRAVFVVRAAGAALCAIIALSCSRSRGIARGAVPVDERTAASAFIRPHASVRPSPTPQWFEFGSAGPMPIAGPLDSSLTPFEPWPLARRGAGLVASGNSVVVAANRDGFLTLVRRADGDIAVYRTGGEPGFSAYSIGAVFAYNGAPTALLYRDRFFVDPTESAAEPRSFSVVKGRTELLSVEIPLLSAYPASQGWDVESLFASVDGRVFLRAVREGAVAYASAPILNGEPAEVSAAAYRTAQLPRTPLDAVPPLRLTLEAAAKDADAGKAKVAAACGKDKPFPEWYLVAQSPNGKAESVLAASEGDVERLWAYYDGARALLLFPNGGYYTAADVGPALRGSFPALPDGFAYTGVALLGKTAVALWEEQDEWAVGSAGFLLVDVLE